MNGLTFWEMLAFTVLGGLGGFLLAHILNPWLRGEERWDDEDDGWDDEDDLLETPLEGYEPRRRFRLVVDDEKGNRTVYDWDQDD